MSLDNSQLQNRVDALESEVLGLHKLIKDLKARIEDLEKTKPGRKKPFIDLSDKVSRSLNTDPEDEISFPSGPRAQ